VVERSASVFPVSTTGLQKIEGALYVRSEERAWFGDAAVDMALRGEMHHQLRSMSLEDGHQRAMICHVNLLERVVPRVDDGCEIRRTRGVSESVSVDEVMAGELRHEEIEKVGTDESGTAGDENSHRPRLPVAPLPETSPTRLQSSDRPPAVSTGRARPCVWRGAGVPGFLEMWESVSFRITWDGACSVRRRSAAQPR